MLKTVVCALCLLPLTCFAELISGGYTEQTYIAAEGPGIKIEATIHVGEEVNKVNDSCQKSVSVVTGFHEFTQSGVTYRIPKTTGSIEQVDCTLYAIPLR